MKTSDFFYELPAELIAQQPLEHRDASRMLVARNNRCTDSTIQNLPQILREAFPTGPLTLVVNDSRVYPARVKIQRSTGAQGEVFFLETGDEKESYKVLLRPQAKLKTGEWLLAGEEPLIQVTSLDPPLVRLACPLSELLARHGQMPLPPYIKRPAPQNSDKERYQTIFASQEGSAAAPTAGLHFTPRLKAACENLGIQFAPVTLHVGLGTFAPVQTENLTDHPMHEEWFLVPKSTAQILTEAQQGKGTIIFVGTTSLRAVESYFRAQQPKETWTATRLFLYPQERPLSLAVGQGLLTNFHQPESTLVMLVSALMGYSFWKRSYTHAIQGKYRFFSYGDANLILFSDSDKT